MSFETHLFVTALIFDITTFTKNDNESRSMMFQPHTKFAFFCHSRETIGNIKSIIKSSLNVNEKMNINVAWKGKLLNENDVLMLDDEPVLHSNDKNNNNKGKQIIVLLSNDNDNNANDNDANNNNNNNTNNDNANSNNNIDDSDRMCRICFSTNDDVILGRLFSPCLCSGTMKYIHVGCLNHWRASSPNETSFYRCENCRYEYNIRRVEWYYILDKRIVSQIISIILLILGIIILGLFSYRLPIANKIWDLIHWNPVVFFTKMCIRNISKNVCNDINFLLNVIGSGVILMGFIGLYVIREWIWRNNRMFILFVFQSPLVLRLLLIVGLVHSFLGLMEITRSYVKKFLFRFGERILEVE